MKQHRSSDPSFQHPTSSFDTPPQQEPHPHAGPRPTPPHAHDRPETTQSQATPQDAPTGQEREFRMAIIDANMLACMGLNHMLSNIIPFATIHVFHSYDQFMNEPAEDYVHYFVAARIYFEHTQFFRQRAYRTIVLINGENLPPMPGILTLNINRSEQELITDLLQLHSHGHGAGPHQPRPNASLSAHSGRPNADADAQPLTPREIEVVTLLGKGFINKEIADRLNISLTTVITHRKNIMTKLNAHSLSDVIIYAVMNGHLDLGE